MTRSAHPSHSRQDIVSLKREERAKRELMRKERKLESYLADDQNFPSFKLQLAKIGLQLRDIPGDGNCLFRALGDQLEGHGRNHFKHRFDVVQYMADHRDDFEPFVEDDLSFDRHIQSLRKLGTYAGNDAIVAFARLRQVNVIIHQLGAPFLLIQGTSSPDPTARQIHIAYHNGDHYSSVRKQNDNVEAPANIRLKVDSFQDKSGNPSMKINTKASRQSSGTVVSAMRDPESIQDEVMLATGCTNQKTIENVLMECDYDVDMAISHILQLQEVGVMTDTGDDSKSETSHWTSTDSGVSSTDHSPKHSRDSSYGRYSDNGYASSASVDNGARPKTFVTGKDKNKMSSKEKKESKKIEKKKRAMERKKQKFLGVDTDQETLKNVEDANVITVVSNDIAMMKI